MKQPMSAISVLMVAYFVGTMTFLFVENLPHWCKTPEVGTNFIVQPLCSKVKASK